MFVIQALLIVLLPALAIWLDKRVKVVNWLGPVVLCYLFGMLLGNVGWTAHELTIKIILSATVLLAIPLLLFSADFIAWLKLAPKTILSFVFMVVAAVVSAALTYYFLGHQMKESWQVAGMLVGMYTGGTPNTIAIGKALGVPEAFYIQVTVADLMFGGIWLLFVLSVAQRFCLLFLPAFERTEEEPDPEPHDMSTLSQSIPRNKKLQELGFAFLLSVVVVAVSIGISFLIAGEVDFLIVILSLTTLGLAASFNFRVRNLSWSFEAGDFLMLVFCTALGMKVNFAKMLQDFQTMQLLLLYTGSLMLGALFLHFLLAAIFRIDADTTLITSAAGIFGPPFIAPIARALGNRQLIVSGLTMSIAGLAVGTYLGILLSKFLQP